MVFDSSTYLRTEKVDAARTAFDELSAPTSVAFVDPRNMSAVMEGWSFGEASMFRASMSAHRLTRTHRAITEGPAGFVALAVQEHGTCHLEQHGRQQFVRPGDLMIVDLDTPYELSWPILGCSRAIHVPRESMAVDDNDLAQLARHLEANPLYHIVRRHIAQLDIGREHEVSDDVGEALGDSTIALVHALRAAGRRGRPDGRYDHAVLLPQIQAFIRGQLGDHELTADAVASRYGFSAPDFRIWTAARGCDINQWILSERLLAVRAELLLSDLIPGDDVARRWGFSDYGHLDGAFHDVYGMCLRHWWEIRDEM